MSRLLTLAAFLAAAIFMSALIQRPAHADCQQTGNDVLCSGSGDRDGFILRAPNLNFRTAEGALVTNVDTGRDSGICPLSFPGVALGVNATVLNQGTITTSGVCGWALEVGNRSTVTNANSLLTVGILGYGLVGDDNVTVTNTGQIVTTGNVANGISLGSAASITNTGGVIATSGLNAAAIDVLNRATITNTGTISARGDLSDGIRTADDSTVVNKTTIFVSGNHGAGIRMSGGTLTLNNSGTISALAEVPTLVPDAGVIMQGNTVNVTNSGNIIAANVGVNLSATESLNFNNSGSVSSNGQGAAQGNAAIVVNVPTGQTAQITNSGLISGDNGAVALRTVSGSVYLANTGYIQGDVVFGSGHDTLEMAGGLFGFTVDGGAGNDTLVLGATGPLFGPNPTIRNIETLRVFATGAWKLYTNATFSSLVGIGRGTLEVGGQITSPLIDIGVDGVLRGAGSVVGAVNNRGMLYPGTGDLQPGNRSTIANFTVARPATFAITGSYTQFSTGTLYLRLNYNFASDQLAVNGPATLNGGKLHLQIGPNGPTNGFLVDSYTLLTATGISGAFTTVETNSFFLKATLTQTATALSAQIARLPYSSVALTRAQRQAGDLLNRAGGSFASLLENVSTADEARSVLNQVAPEVYPAVQNTGLFSLTAIRDSLRGKTALAGESWHAWGAYVLRGGDEPTSAQSYDIQGAIAGMGKKWPDGTAIGISVGHTAASDTFNNSPDRADFDTTFAALTAAHTWDDVTLESGVVYGGGDVSVQRAIALNGTSQTLSSTPSATLLSVYSDATMSRIMGPLDVTPRIGIAYDRMELGAIDERASGSIKTTDSTVQTLRGEIGLRATAMTARIRPYGGVTASWDVLGEPRAIPVVFNGPAFNTTTGFILKGEHPKRFNLDIEGGVNFAINDNFTGSVGGRIAANDRFAGHSVVARLLWLW